MQLLVREIKLDQELLKNIGANQTVIVHDRAAVNDFDRTVLKLKTANFDGWSQSDVSFCLSLVTESCHAGLRKLFQASFFGHPAVDQNSSSSGVQKQLRFVIT